MSVNSGGSSSKMVETKSKNKVLSCSTPEHRSESPSRDSDSLCDSDAASPVLFLCTQDGAEGETDVVWNFYTPKADHPKSRIKNSTPLSRKTKKCTKPKLIEKPIPKRKPVRTTQKNTELFQDLIELNQNLHELIAKRSNKVTEKRPSGSEDDIFNDSGESSPKSGLRTKPRCLRRNVLSSKFNKPETETALESDDSMNECLIKASQVVEEEILNEPTAAKRICYETSKNVTSYKPGVNLKMDNDSMDAILNSIKLDSPLINKTNNCDSPRSINDSFDSIVGNLNDSALEHLTQMPGNSNTARNNLNSSKTDWTIQDIVVHDGSSTNKSIFGRHSSMPESPSITDNKPSTSGMAFSRYNSMPTKEGDSPIRCTQEEIKRKHQMAREKLMAKRLLPFTSTQQQSSQQSVPEPVQKKLRFQPKVSSSSIRPLNYPNHSNSLLKQTETSKIDLKQLIEKKRQEALMKLRKRQTQK